MTDINYFSLKLENLKKEEKMRRNTSLSLYHQTPSSKNQEQSQTYLSKTTTTTTKIKILSSKEDGNDGSANAVGGKGSWLAFSRKLKVCIAHIPAVQLLAAQSRHTHKNMHQEPFIW